MSDNLDVNDGDVLHVEWGNPKLMGFCSICNTSPCNAVNHYFGVCPVCHGTDGYLNVGHTHVFICKTHKTAWAIGADLFSSCMEETPEEQRAEQEQIGFAEYRKVEPHYAMMEAEGEHERAAEAVQEEEQRNVLGE